jgi:hypothetical protein
LGGTLDDITRFMLGMDKLVMVIGCWIVPDWPFLVMVSVTV